MDRIANCHRWTHCRGIKGSATTAYTCLPGPSWRYNCWWVTSAPSSWWTCTWRRSYLTVEDLRKRWVHLRSFAAAVAELFRVLTDDADDEQNKSNGGEEIAHHRIDGAEGGPMRMDEVLHIIGHKVDHFNSGRVSPLHGGASIIIERTRIQHSRTNDFQSTIKRWIASNELGQQDQLIWYPLYQATQFILSRSNFQKASNYFQWFN